MFASTLLLNRMDMRALCIKDAYSLHRVVYGLYEPNPNQQDNPTHSTGRILYADKGGNHWQRKILTLADRPPMNPERGSIETKPVPNDFLSFDHYAFEIMINPTKRDNQSGRMIVFKEKSSIAQWFINKAPSAWGFHVNADRLSVEQIGVQRIKKGGRTITHGYATLKGVLTVYDQSLLANSFCHGLGRGRAFGLGLLQVVPLRV